MKAPLLRTAHAALIFLLATGAAAGQAKNHEFTTTAVSSSRVWTLGNTQVPSNSITEALMESLAQRLTGQGFKRVQTLNTYCCVVQIELVNATGRTVTAKISLFNLDRQPAYSKTYDGEAAGTGGKGIMQDAVTAVVSHALADPQFLKNLSGT